MRKRLLSLLFVSALFGGALAPVYAADVETNPATHALVGRRQQGLI